MRFGVGVGEVAGQFVLYFAIGHIRKGQNVVVAVLNFALFKIYRPAVEAGGGARLEAAHLIAELYEVFGERGGGGKAVGAAASLYVAGNRFGVQIYARGEYCCLAVNYPAVGRLYAAHLSVFGEYFGRFALNYAQVFRMFQSALHLGVVGVFVRLAPQRLHRRALAHVEHPYLQGGLVGIYAHFAAQCVYLAHQVPLGSAAYRRIARHKGNAVKVQREHCRFKSRPCAGEGGFTARVPRAHNNYVELSFGEQICHISHFKCPRAPGHKLSVFNKNRILPPAFKGGTPPCFCLAKRAAGALIRAYSRADYVFYFLSIIFFMSSTSFAMRSLVRHISSTLSRE